MDDKMYEQQGQPVNQQPQQNYQGQPMYQQPQQNYGQPQGQTQYQQNYQQTYQAQPAYQQPNTYQTNDAQGQGSYQSYGDPNNMYSVEGASVERHGFGIASLVLGILALCTFCLCINIVFAILSIIFGIVQLVQSGPKGLAIAGIITSGLSIVFMIIYWILVSNGLVDANYYVNTPGHHYEWNNTDYDDFDDYDDFL